MVLKCDKMYELYLILFSPVLLFRSPHSQIQVLDSLNQGGILAAILGVHTAKFRFWTLNQGKYLLQFLTCVYVVLCDNVGCVMM